MEAKFLSREKISLHKNWSFPLRISSVNVTKSEVSKVVKRDWFSTFNGQLPVNVWYQSFRTKFKINSRKCNKSAASCSSF